MKIFELDIFGFTLTPSYYGLMYVLWFLYGIWAIHKTKKYTKKQIDDLFFFVFLWVLLGWRLWYMLFYDLSDFLSNPLSLFRVWEGGMSFHGGFLWVVTALYLYSKRKNISFLSLSDDLAKIIPMGIFFGRIWNYLNKELLWFPYSWPFAVQTTHWSFFPSPLVEAFLEGIVIFIILNFILRIPKFPGQFAALFLIFYGIFRTCVEIFIRTPDPQIGYYFWFLTQGSLLSIPMIVIGWVLYIILNKKYARK